jgi:hypothetical protein
VSFHDKYAESGVYIFVPIFSLFHAHVGTLEHQEVRTYSGMKVNQSVGFPERFGDTTNLAEYSGDMNGTPEILIPS